MNNKIRLIAFATCGNPYGFRQTLIGESYKTLAGQIKTFDLNTNAIKLFPGGKIYSIRKELVDGNCIVSYAIYSFAKEQNSSRGGTFIGSGIIFVNEIADENITINKLNEFHENLVSKNIQNDIIMVNHSDNFSVSVPEDFDKINFHLREIEDISLFQSLNKNLVVYSKINPNKLQQLFKKAIDLLNVYDNIYFTNNNEIAKFIIQKGLFKLVEEDGFEQEIQNLHEERKRKTQESIAEFEKEKEKLEEDKRKLIQEYNLQIEQNERLHQENKRRIAESKNAIGHIHQNYANYSRKIEVSIEQLRTDEKLEEVQRQHNENKRIFIGNLNQQKMPISLNNIHKPHIKTGLQEVRETIYPEQNFISNRMHGKRDEDDSINIYKIISLFLILLLAGILTYFFAFYTHEENSILLSEEEKFKVEQPLIYPQTIQGLVPNSNNELNEKGYKVVANKVLRDMKLDEVVQLIFDANPSDIKKAYLYQKDNYGKLLISLNNNSFKELGKNSFYFTGDTIKRIPIYLDSLALQNQ